MKNLSKCYLYFGLLFLLCVFAPFLNYFFTHDQDGFLRLESLNLDLPKFYCFRQIHMYEQCKSAAIDDNASNDGEDNCDDY